jgi:hypothetical protein
MPNIVGAHHPSVVRTYRRTLRSPILSKPRLILGKARFDYRLELAVGEDVGPVISIPSRTSSPT